jgi:hypothetical protein
MDLKTSSLVSRQKSRSRAAPSPALAPHERLFARAFDMGKRDLQERIASLRPRDNASQDHNHDGSSADALIKSDSVTKQGSQL